MEVGGHSRRETESIRWRSKEVRERIVPIWKLPVNLDAERPTDRPTHRPTKGPLRGRSSLASLPLEILPPVSWLTRLLAGRKTKKGTNERTKGGREGGRASERASRADVGGRTGRRTAPGSWLMARGLR